MKRQSGTSKDASQESKKADWFTGAGNPISFEEIINIVKTHSDRNGIVYVGSDSFVEKDDCIFSTAICLWKGDSQSGGRYFIKRNRLDNKQYTTLMQRITSEVQKSIDVGLKILAYCPQVKIELHLDISESDKNTKTSKFADMLVGYAKGIGFDCKIKPQAFAASSVADKHSK